MTHLGAYICNCTKLDTSLPVEARLYTVLLADTGASRASFFATGDNRYLENLFRYAGRALPKGDVGSMLVIGAATWSFKVNCRQHKRVLDFAKQELASTTVSGEQNAFLKECVAYAEAIDAEPHAPGDAPQAARP